VLLQDTFQKKISKFKSRVAHQYKNKLWNKPEKSISQKSLF
jgi:hypothetical protein